MAKPRSKPKIVAENAQPAPKLASKAVGAKKTAHDVKENLWAERFSAMACVIAHWMGKPIAFLIALAAVLVWAATGPLFGYSDTWQLVINTSTTIVTFLMVFLIQNTQNRDAKATHLKLDELLRAAKGARNSLVCLENLSDREMEELEEEFKRIKEGS